MFRQKPQGQTGYYNRRNELKDAWMDMYRKLIYHCQLLRNSLKDSVLGSTLTNDILRFSNAVDDRGPETLSSLRKLSMHMAYYPPVRRRYPILRLLLSVSSRLVPQKTVKVPKIILQKLQAKWHRKQLT